MDQRELAEAVLETFVQRRDVYAVQRADGAYHPVHAQITPELVAQHLAGIITLGHYVLDTDSATRVICFDVDLEAEGVWMSYPDFEDMPGGLTRAEEDAWTAGRVKAYSSRPREDWRDRAHPGRLWYKQLLRTMGDALAYGMRHELGVPTLLTYSGSKGVHAYGLTGPVQAAEARAGAELAMATAGKVLGGSFAPSRGSNFYKMTDGPIWAASVAVERFPKQDSLDGKKLGNLIRLPLGVNQKSPDPCFIVDERKALTHLEPVENPLDVLLARSAH